MPDTKRAVFLKISGEKLSGSSISKGCWDKTALIRNAQNISAAHTKLNGLGISGLTIICGGGNIARGDKLKGENISPRYADVVGRGATILNTIVLADTLQAASIPCEIFIATKMSYNDPSIATIPYTPEALKSAHAQGKVCLIAGGTGEDNVTTDNAVVLYASSYRKVFDGEVIVLKSTQFDGVFESDPKTNPGARRYKSISAQSMLNDYERFKVVDKTSLTNLVKHGLTMRVYDENEHDLAEMLNGKNGGTIIVPTATEAVYY